MKNGIALVPENRKEEGLYKVQSVRFNMTIEIMDQFIKGIRVNEKKEIEITQKYIDMMSTKLRHNYRKSETFPVEISRKSSWKMACHQSGRINYG